MSETLDIGRIKQYNNNLRELKEKSSQTDAALKFASEQLSSLCRELTDELGVQVTPDNLEEIYKQCVEKIENTLATGEGIIARVRQAELGAQQSEQIQNNMLNQQMTPQIAPQTQAQATPEFTNMENEASGILPGFTNLPPMFSKQMSNTEVKI